MSRITTLWDKVTAPRVSPPLSPERPAGEVEARRVLPPPFECSNPHYSLVYPAVDEPFKPSARLLSLAADIVKEAANSDTTEIAKRLGAEGSYVDIWPGEHYKVLPALVKALKPKLIIEIGTAAGSSALMMKQALEPDARIVTFDIVPWNQYQGTILKESDFGSQLSQEICDLSDITMCQKFENLLAEADLIFLDAAKDGKQEECFLWNFGQVKFKKNPIFMLDDVRLWNMLAIWKNIQRPKLDFTSFGHWSGTGFIDWNGQCK